MNAHITEKIAEKIVTALKLLKIFNVVNVGKIINADISSDPTRFMPSTTITAITTEINKLYSSVFVPVAFAKFSSNVTAKILL